MSQRGVERALGRLVTDEGFRDAFYADPEAASLQIGVDLTPAEAQALRRIPKTALAELCQRLDDRICRLHIPSQASREELP